MRDIRGDLRERLDAIEGRRRDARASYEALMKDIDAEAVTIKGLLDIENVRYPEAEEAEQPAPDEALAAFLLRAITAVHPTKDELTQMAEKAGYGRERQSMGRVVHFTVVNMLKRGQVREENGHYYLNPAPGVGSTAP